MVKKQASKIVKDFIKAVKLKDIRLGGLRFYLVLTLIIKRMKTAILILQ